MALLSVYSQQWHVAGVLETLFLIPCRLDILECSDRRITTFTAVSRRRIYCCLCAMLRYLGLCFSIHLLRSSATSCTFPFSQLSGAGSSIGRMSSFA